jgi:hypothetical protein
MIGDLKKADEEFGRTVAVIKDAVALVIAGPTA